MEKILLETKGVFISGVFVPDMIKLNQKTIKYLKSIKGNEDIDFKTGWNKFKLGGCSSAGTCGVAPIGYVYQCIGGNCVLLPI